MTAYYAWVTSKILEQSGPVIEIDLKQAWVHVSGQGCLTLPLDKGVREASPHPEYPTFVFAIEVRNSGGAGATIEKGTIEMPGGVSFWQPAPTIGPSFPHRLEAHSSVTFFVEPQAVGTAIEVLKLKPRVAATVLLASGAVVRTAEVAL